MTSSMINDEPIDAELLKRLLNVCFNDEVTSDNVLQSNNYGEEFDVFPLTNIQRGYFIGRNPNVVLGGSSCQFYYEVDCEHLNIDAYQKAWQQVIHRHPMLRAIMLNASEQKVLENVPEFSITLHDLRQEENESPHIEAIRTRIAKDTRPYDQWPLFDVEISRLSNNHCRIHLGFDLLIADQYSILTVMKEVAILCRFPETRLPMLNYSFRNYVIDSEAAISSDRERAKSYWISRIDTIPEAPQLPLLEPLHAIEKPRYQRISRHLDSRAWEKIKTIAAELGVTPSCILLALFGEALCYAIDMGPSVNRGFSSNTETLINNKKLFTLNMTLFNRQALHPNINQVVGDFTSNLLFAMDLRHATSRRDFFTQVQKDLWRDIEHSAFTGIEVMLQMAKQAGHLDQPVMPVVFTCTLSQADTDLYSGTGTQLGTPVFQAAQTPQAILDNQLIEWEGQLQINWDITTNALDIELATHLLDHYISLMQVLADESDALDRNVAELADPSASMLAPSIINPKHKQANDYSRLSDLWLEVLPHCSHQPAIKTLHHTVSHQQLAEQVSGICWQLSELGVAQGDNVCIALPKSTSQVAACLAISIFGAVYVPIDSEQPQGRIQKILLNVKPKAVITQDLSNVDGMFQTNADFCIINIATISSRDMNELFEYQTETADTLAYIIYTSGSTGIPKGVCVNHQASINTCVDINQRFGVQASDCVMGLSALHFDLSVYDIFGVLGKGSSIALPESNELQNPQHWAALCKECDVTIWNSVPALWSLLVNYLSLNTEKIKPAIHTAMLSGDWIPLGLVPETQTLFPDIDLYSLGGATEAAIWSIYYPIKAVKPEWKSIPYGKALGGQQVFVLNQDLQVVLPGQTGDIYIAGVGLAQGYYKDEEKTSHYFFKHPRTDLPLYRTGDLGCYDSNGTIEFKGRSDSQLKINGYRVELGEISRSAVGHNSVQDAVVLPVPVHTNNGSNNAVQLTAFIKASLDCLPILNQRCKEIAYTQQWEHLKDVQHFLTEQLPYYMLPVHYYILGEWPLTSNGKINTAVLQTIVSINTAQKEALPLHSELLLDDKKEHQQASLVSSHCNYLNNTDNYQQLSQDVLAIVAEVLNVNHVGLDDNLVALGASSVELIALATRIEKLANKRPPLPELARAVQLSDLVDLVAKLMSVNTDTSTLNNKIMDAEEYLTPIFSQEKKFRYHLDKTPVITDVNSRKLFKTKRQSQANLLDSNFLLDSAHQQKYIRKSWRDFSSSPTTMEQLSQLLSPLREYFINGKKTYHYASAGGVYPVEVYLIQDAEKVQGLERGGYFYNAHTHALDACDDAYRDTSLSTRPFSELSGLNSDWVKRAHFLICFVIHMDKVVPLYEAASLPYSLIECGAMTQLLEQHASRAGIGVCQVGDLSLERLGEQLNLPDNRLCLHALVGGALDDQTLKHWQTLSANYSQVMTEGEL
jgi:pyochelin synthetase